MRPLARHAANPPERAHGWWRRNALALVALPVALAAALAASSDRVLLYFWEEGLREPVHGSQGRWVAVDQTYTDALGEHPRRVKVRLDGVRPAPGVDVPPGSRAVAVRLSLEADPQTSLTGCSIAVRDAEGTRYAVGGGNTSIDQGPFPCVPADTPGPLAAINRGPQRPSDDPARPPAWSVAPILVLPQGVEVRDVLIWWELPDYVAIAAGSRAA